MTSRIFIAAACSVFLAAASPSNAQPDPLAGHPTGLLTVTIEVDGQHRHVNNNKVEWHELNVSRLLRLELPMVMMGTGPRGFRNSEESQEAKAEDANAGVPAGILEMQKAMEACNGDQQCLIQTGTKLGQMMKQGAIQMPQAPSMDDMKRFELWAADRRVPCARGTLAINDSGHGMEISPPNPAAPFRYTRTGTRSLPAEIDPVIEQACAATFALDTQNNSVDIAVSGPFVPVKLTYTGNFASETGTSMPFVEGAKNGERVGAVDLFDFAVDADATSFGGQRRIENFGSVTHAGGYGTTPVGATIAWKFVRN